MVQAEPTLQRMTSTIPTSCTQTESTVLPVNITKAWASFSAFKFNEIAPGVVANVEWTDGEAGKLGACAKVTYTDGAEWTLRFTELSEKHHTIGYELMVANPSVPCTSVQGTLQLLRVTDGDQTFLSWTTEFSNDADLCVIEDQKHKKQDTFANIKATLAAAGGQ